MRRFVAVLVGFALAPVLVPVPTVSSTVVSAARASAAHAATATASESFWTRCGSIQCGSLTVPLTRSSRAGTSTAPRGSGGTIALPVYGRPARTGFGTDLLVLIADRDTAQSARLLVERAPLVLGAASGSYTVVSLAVRDSQVAPLPAGAHGAAGTLDAVEDLRALVTALGARRVRVIGWGSGATIAAAWVMTRPGDIVAAVLDSPVDPSASMVAQGIARRDAMARGVESMMRWCASHLSCPLNQETRLTWRRLMREVANGDATASLSANLIAGAGYAALHTGDFSVFFRGLVAGFKGDVTALQALAARVPAPEKAMWRCADLRPRAARALARAWADTEAVSWRWFEPGDHRALFTSCTAAAGPKPLGALVPVRAATGAKVYVTMARFDPTHSTTGPRALATKMKWRYRSVPATRHLVVGHDRAMTARIMAFLAG